MRVEPHAVDSYVHAMKRGARGLPLTKNISEQRRFMRLLFFMNDHYSNDAWERETRLLGTFERPQDWPEQRPLVKVLAWTLMPNHFHLLLKETEDGGISKFMQKLGNSMSTYANLKHKEKGSLFQGAYKGRTVRNDAYLRHLASYIMVKNVFELYPGGFLKAAGDFDRAWQWGIEAYPFSSLADYALDRKSPIIEKDILGEIFDSCADFRTCSREMILSKTAADDEILQAMLIDDEPIKLRASDSRNENQILVNLTAR